MKWNWYLVSLVTGLYPRKHVFVYVILSGKNKVRASHLALEAFPSYTTMGFDPVLVEQDEINYLLWQETDQTVLDNIYIVKGT